MWVRSRAVYGWCQGSAAGCCQRQHWWACGCCGVRCVWWRACRVLGPRPQHCGDTCSCRVRVVPAAVNCAQAAFGRVQLLPRVRHSFRRVASAIGGLTEVCVSELVCLAVEFGCECVACATMCCLYITGIAGGIWYRRRHLECAFPLSWSTRRPAVTSLIKPALRGSAF